MSLRPGSYNQVHPEDGGKVRTKCACGWATSWRKAGGRFRSIIPSPFNCPKCDQELSQSTVLV